MKAEKSVKVKAYNKQISKKMFLLAGYHKVTPVKAINKYNSRFAYKIKDVKGYSYKGLWALDYADVNRGGFGYVRIE